MKTKITILTSILGLCFLASALAELPVPPQSKLLLKKGNSRIYLSKSDQNYLESYYKAVLKKQGYNYLPDKELRKQNMRRLTFENKGLIAEIVLVGKGQRGTEVAIDEYPYSDDLVDVSSMVSRDKLIIVPPDIKSAPPIKKETKQTAPESLEFEVPDPLEAKSLDRVPPDLLNLFTANTEVKAYTTKRDIKAQEDHFTRELKKRGFSIRKDKSARIASVKRIFFQRKDLVVDIMLNVCEGGSQVVIGKYLESNGGIKAERNPFALSNVFPREDVGGSDEDFIDVPRPSESVRWMKEYNKMTKGTIISYTSTQTIPDLGRFYVKTMPSYGWKLESNIATKDAMEAFNKYSKTKTNIIIPKLPFADTEDLSKVIQDSYILDFKNKTAKVRITIFPNFVNRKLGSMVNINYFPLIDPNKARP